MYREIHMADIPAATSTAQPELQTGDVLQATMFRLLCTDLILPRLTAEA